jgi:tetratricopeptide (TPR) repeat protein
MPQRRYAAAADLADDLHRFLKHQPVHARPVGPLEKLKLWARRNRMVAALLSVSLLLLVSLVAAGAIFSCVYRNAALTETELRKQAQQQEQAAIALFAQARQTVDELTEFSENEMLNVPGLQPLRMEMLKTALKYYRDFIGTHGDDPDVQASLADAYERVGDITMTVRSPREAETAFQDAVNIYNRLSDQRPDQPQFVEGLAKTYNKLGTARRANRQLASAMKCHHEAIEIYSQLLTRFPDHPKYEIGLSVNLTNLGSVLIDNSQADLALDPCREATEIMERVVSRDPNNAKYRFGLARSYTILGPPTLP